MVAPRQEWLFVLFDRCTRNSPEGSLSHGVQKRKGGEELEGLEEDKAGKKKKTTKESVLYKYSFWRLFETKKGRKEEVFLVRNTRHRWLVGETTAAMTDLIK